MGIPIVEIHKEECFLERIAQAKLKQMGEYGAGYFIKAWVHGTALFYESVGETQAWLFDELFEQQRNIKDVRLIQPGAVTRPKGGQGFDSPLDGEDW